jgi:hypothetical protein
MQAALKLHTTVQPGHRIEVTDPKLPEGADVEITVTLPFTSEQTEEARRFRSLAEVWHRETAALSSVSQMAMHPAYQEIIGMGRDAVPLILKELQQTPGHWFWALRAITGDDPVKPEHRGRVREMAAAWVEWGKERGYIS